MLVNVAEQRASPREMLDPLRHQPHDPAAGGIHRDRITSENQYSTSLRGSLDRPVTFHPHNAVHDGKIWPGNGVDVQNGSLDPRPMQHVLGPAIAASRDDAEHVFERQGNARPMM